MIEAIEKNLLRGVYLLNSISDKEYSNQSVPPYFSSVGCHIRHILDMFSCVFKGLENGNIDFTCRERKEVVEQSCAAGIEYYQEIIKKLNSISKDNLSTDIYIKDDLGLGSVSSKTTLGAVLMHVQSHTIHHYASIANIIYQQGIVLPDSDFGFNPSTPKKVNYK